MYEDKIYVPQSLRGRTIEWYHYYLNHPGGDRLANTLLQVCFGKGLTHQAKQFAKACQQCQRFKKRKVRYGLLPPKDIGELQPWHTVHVDLIGPYTVTAKQQQPANKIVSTELKLTCMTFIDPATGWFEIAEVPTYDLDEVKAGNKEYIDKTSARISLLFNNYWLSRYPPPVEVVYDNGSEFKKDFQPLIEDFDIKPKCTTVENPQVNALVERVHQVIHNMIRTKDLSNRVFDYIDPWGEILSSIAWAIRASYHSTLGATPAQLVFGRDMIFNIKTIVDWRTITARKQKQVIKDNLRENKGRIDHQYSVGDKVYLRPTGIQRKLEMQKKGPYCITHVFANGTVRLQIGATNV
jgi:Integrase core domain.